jgi:hypothetical protein
MGIDALTQLFTTGPWLPAAIHSGMNSYGTPGKTRKVVTPGNRG